MTVKNEQRLQLTTEEAKKLIRNAPNGSSFNLTVRIDLPIADKPDRIFPDAGATWLKLSRADALELVSKLLPDVLQERGARIPIRSYQDDRTRFNRKTREWNDGTRHVFWIG